MEGPNGAEWTMSVSFYLCLHVLLQSPVFDQTMALKGTATICKKFQFPPSHQLLTRPVSPGQEEPTIIAKRAQNWLPVRQRERYLDLAGDGQSPCQESTDR